MDYQAENLKYHCDIAISECIYANQKMGANRGGIVNLIIGQRVRKQSKRSNPNKHTCAAEYHRFRERQSLHDPRYGDDVYRRSQ
jgi:hypothetical protein